MRAFAQVNDETWYVLVSRARHRVVAITDCKPALHEQVMVDGDRKSVWEHERDERRRRQQQERDSARQPDKTQVADPQEHAIRNAREAARRSEGHRRHDDALKQARKRGQGRSPGHGMGL